MSVGAILGAGLGLVLFVYILARVIFHAYFLTRRDFVSSADDRRKKPGVTNA